MMINGLGKGARGVGLSQRAAGGRRRVLGKSTVWGVLAFVLVLGCVLANVLLSAKPAPAASRGFRLVNGSNHALRLEGARALPTYRCVGFHCVPSHYPIDIEGRPADGAELRPSNTHDWELKYGFSLTGGVQYAANVVYKIEGTDATVEYQMMTYSTSNESSCKVIGTSLFTCTAAGTRLTFEHRGQQRPAG